jgi:hypothetical protein
MKKILSMLAAVLLVAISGYSQSPGFFNYQGVARNSVGNVLKNQNIGIRLTVRDGSSGGTVVYQESRTAVTNPFGLFNVQVGSAGATNVTGTILGVNWSVGSKYIQVEVDPAGGTNFINIGTAQLASVPYSLYATTSGDMVLPFNKTQADAGSLFKITNSGTGAGSTSLEGVTNSTAGNAAAVKGIVSSVSAGGFSTGVLGQNNGNAGLGIGVTGTQAGSGWGVYGVTPSGIGVNGSSTSGIGVNGTSTSGTGGRFTTTSGLALHTTGGVRFQGIGEAASRVLGSDASGNATWQTVAALGAVTGSGTLNLLPKWTPSGTVLGNSLLFDDGNSVALGTTAPTHRFTVIHGGSTGIGVSSTSGFSVVDINAASGDAALRFGNGGVNQWNMRNRPGDNYLEWFELGGGGSRMVIQDGTGNVGIGETANPTYKLDVLHGGSTGIRSRSSGSFSVVDIDAASGDAALRFARAGVNQWNIRNRPADDYLEIFELGGGGSRVVIQDGTGNVGIGETTAPSYKLDVLHGGSTGIRSRSSGSFSVVDIDAASGDAALRFANAGVNQWNIRNQPGTDNLQIFELGGGGERMHIQNSTGNVSIGGEASPAYRLDVLHGGATGARIRSSSTFSVIDIDADNGDAALRFAKAGVNQWNTRNRPADDYYEIFELGGGGSRFVIQDGTGNVGINTDPSYKLDVLHGGATGIRSRSSSTFSLIDIDAANGDAALRFAKAGVNQWNIRNRPADDYLEIFELGGGGSRFVIQDGTGNVGINTDPSYKLDVLHGGATGIRSRSSSTFSLIDIDAANGDAALRFAKAGVNQWNIRNNPATDDLQIFELGGGGERMRIDNTTGQVVVSGDFTALGVKAFTMDHPLDPVNKTLMHAAIESNEVLNAYSGNVVTDASGKATVKLPDYFEAINKDFRYQLTVIGSFAQAIINKEVSNNQFEIATNQPNVKVSWEVKGVRNDAHMQKTPFVAEKMKPVAQRGKYLDPAAHNQTADKGVSYDAAIQSSLSDNKPAEKKAAPATSGGSLDQQAIQRPSVKPVDVSGSVMNTEPAKVSVKALDKTGSVEDVPAKPVEAKPATETKGTSTEDLPKPAAEKKAANEEGSVKG